MQTKMKTRQLSTLTLALVISVSLATTVWMQSSKMPTDPLGGKPPVGSKPSVKNLSSGLAARP